MNKGEPMKPRQPYSLAIFILGFLLVFAFCVWLTAGIFTHCQNVIKERAAKIERSIGRMP